MADALLRAGTTIIDYIKGFENEVMRNRIVPAKLKQKGRVKYNCAGDGFQWQVLYKRAPVVTNDGSEGVTPVRRDRFKTCFLDYEGFVTSDRITKRERLKNRGKAALINYVERMTELLKDDLEDQFSEEVYVDGPANDGRWDGFDSFTAHTQTITSTNTTTTARTANAADPFGYPNDTYATLSTQLGAVTGSWGAGPWPFGTGSASYDYFSPVLINHTSTYFGNSTWADNCVKAIRLGLAASRKNKSRKGMMDTVLTDMEGFYEYKNKLDSKERVTVSESLGMPHFGFREAIRQDGATVTWEYGVPRDSSPGQTGEGVQCYGFNFDCMQLRSMQDRLFVVDPLEYDRFTRSWTVIADILGQWQFYSPREFAKWLSIA